VQYDITEAGWFIVQAHLYAGDTAPKKAAPGSFPFNSGPVHDTNFAFTVALAELGVSSGDELFIAAHAVVENENNIIGYEDPDLGAFAAALPDQVQEIVTVNDSLFGFEISGGSGSLADGSYVGYCIDNGHYIYPANFGSPGTYTANVYSSYEALPDSLTTAYDQPLVPGIGGQVPAQGINPNIDNPDNLDLVNWVINNADGYTPAQVQNVIWALVDDALNRDSLTAQEQVLFDMALASGEGFAPGCGDLIAVILQPVDSSGNTTGQVTIAQVTFAQVGITCDPIFQSETGWASPSGDGVVKFKQGWGSYFPYTL
jgi:hypothetical protein